MEGRDDGEEQGQEGVAPEREGEGHVGEGGYSPERGVLYASGGCDVEAELRIAARHLEVRAVDRLGNYCKGPYLQHNFLVRCAEVLGRENGRVGRQERVWPILPWGGLYSKPGDVLAFLTWLAVLLFPVIVIPVACYCGNEVNIPNCIVCTMLLMGHVTAAFLASKNCKKFKRLWFTSSVNIQRYMGLQNYVAEVSPQNINSLEFVSAGKRKEILQHLSLIPERRAWVMLCTKAFWASRVTDPLICLFFVAFITLIALIVQLCIISTQFPLV